MSFDNNKFNYTYSAKEQNEIKEIREKYIKPKTESKESKIERLRRLDASVTSKATAASLALGILGLLILGAGMSIILSPISEILGIVLAMILGITLGIIGLVGIAFAYPVYTAVLKRERAAAAPEIISLLEELEE